jgi:transcriptional regulator with XRE-family HTH domain
MSYGYSQRLVDSIRQGDPDSVGVALGRACIKLDIPVQQIAEQLGVSRTTVYNWFIGLTAPSPKHHAAINKLLKRLK